MSRIQIFVGKAEVLRKLVNDHNLIVNVPIPDDKYVRGASYLSYLRVVGRHAYVHRRIYRG